MNTELEGRHVVVTGGTGELGAAIVAEVLGRGGVVHVPCRDARRPGSLGTQRSSRLVLEGGIDFADDAAVRKFYAELPGLWASIHAVGAFALAPVVETSTESFGRLMETNAASCFLACREAVRAIRRTSSGGPEGKGRIVNVAAMPALEPRRGAGMVAYTASKAAVVAITIALAEEVAREEIWVNAVAPAILDTRANHEAMPQADSSGWAKLEQVATTVAFLISLDNRVARGAIVPVYGRG